jgi:hypothetical protein
MFAAQPSPDGHGVGNGRNSVGVPPTVKIVDAMLDIVAERRREKIQVAFLSYIFFPTATVKS